MFHSQSLPRSFGLIVITLFILLGNASGQEKTDPIPAKEEKAMQDLARKFVGRLSETNDVTPLLSEFISDNAGECLLKHFDEDPELRDLKLNAPELTRFLAALSNYQYLNFVWADGDQGTTIPTELTSRYSDASQAFLHSFARDHDRTTAFNKLGELESVEREVRDYLQSHPIKLSKADQSKYQVSRSSGSEYCAPPDAPANSVYVVETPVGLIILMVKDGTEYKIALIAPNMD